MHDVMSAHVERGEAPGIVTLVSRAGEPRVDAIGEKTLGGGDPIARDTIFRISSMTKPIAAAATMVLVEEGRLRLDEPVDRLLPELADAATLRLEVRAPITLRIAPRVVPAGGSFQMRGRLLAAPRRQGKLVALEAHERGRWRPFELVDATRRGRYRARWRFSPGARGTYPIRAVAVAEASYPYAVGRSRPVRVRVR